MASLAAEETGCGAVVTFDRAAAPAGRAAVAPTVSVGDRNVRGCHDTIRRRGPPDQEQLLTDRAVFTEAYAVIPARSLRDITANALPHWQATRAWVLARPMSGFAETFSHHVMEVGPGGGSDRPEPGPGAEGVLFVIEGEGRLDLH